MSPTVTRRPVGLKWKPGTAVQWTDPEQPVVDRLFRGTVAKDAGGPWVEVIPEGYSNGGEVPRELVAPAEACAHCPAPATRQFRLLGGDGPHGFGYRPCCEEHYMEEREHRSAVLGKHLEAMRASQAASGIGRHRP